MPANPMPSSPHKKDSRRNYIKVYDKLPPGWPIQTQGNKSLPKKGPQTLFFNGRSGDYAGHSGPQQEPLPQCRAGCSKHKMCRHRRAKQRRNFGRVSLKNFWRVQMAPGQPNGKHMDAKGVVCKCGKCGAPERQA